MRVFRAVKNTPEINKGAILEQISGGQRGYNVRSGQKKVCKDQEVYFVSKVVEEQPQWFEEVFVVYATSDELKKCNK